MQHTVQKVSEYIKLALIIMLSILNIAVILPFKKLRRLLGKKIFQAATLVSKYWLTKTGNETYV